MSEFNTNMPKNQQRVAVGLSGGVDSSVSAYLLKEQGYDVVGVYMKCWDGKADGCRSDEDRIDAVKVANKLGIKFEYLNFVDAYKEKVIDHFYNEYRAGRTPNPDVLCNRDIKFGLFMKWALENKFDYIATGHYARVKEENGVFKLLSGVDTTKDQSYFLYLLDQAQLSRTIFPVGELNKKEVREIAQKAGLHTSTKPDSVGICFIGEVDIKEFLKQRIDPKEGNVVDKEGEVIGSHEGVWFYTIGQRHGFTVEKYSGIPMYVIGKNIEKNELIAGFASDVNKNSFNVSELHWVDKEPASEFSCRVRIRHLGELFEATVIHSGKAGHVQLVNSVFGVAPGQSAVFYDGDEVIGGGAIEV